MLTRHLSQTDIEPEFQERLFKAKAFLSTVKRTKKVNRRVGSTYSWKHIAERQLSGVFKNSYISESAFIVAAKQMGFSLEVRYLGPREVMHYINISSRDTCSRNMDQKWQAKKAMLQQAAEALRGQS